MNKSCSRPCRETWLFGLLWLISLQPSFAEEPIRIEVSCAATYSIGEPLLMLVTATNVSPEVQPIIDLAGGWADMSFLNFEIQGPRSTRNRPYTAGADRHGNQAGMPIALAAGEASIGEFDISKYSITVEQGTNTVAAIYRLVDKQGTSHQIKSTPVSFDLRAPDPEDAEVMGLLKWEHSAGGLKMDATDDYFYTQLGYEQKYLAVLRDHPNSTLAKYAAFYLARYYSAKGRGKDATPILKRLTEAQEEFPLTDDALLLLANDYLAEPGEHEKAQMVLEKLVSKFSKGNCARDARRKLDELKGKKNKE